MTRMLKKHCQDHVSEQTFVIILLKDYYCEKGKYKIIKHLYVRSILSYYELCF